MEVGILVLVSNVVQGGGDSIEKDGKRGQTIHNVLFCVLNVPQSERKIVNISNDVNSKAARTGMTSNVKWIRTFLQCAHLTDPDCN